MKAWRRIIHDEEGISGVEYALLLAIIGAGLAAAAAGLGGAVEGNIDTATGYVST